MKTFDNQTIIEKEDFVESIIDNIESKTINSDLESKANKIISLSKSELSMIIHEIKVLDIQNKQEEKISYYFNEIKKNLEKYDGAYIGRFDFEKDIITPKIINKIIKMLNDKNIKTKFLQANLMCMKFLIYLSDEKLKNSFNFSSDKDLYTITRELLWDEDLKRKFVSSENEILKLVERIKIFKLLFLIFILIIIIFCCKK